MKFLLSSLTLFLLALAVDTSQSEELAPDFSALGEESLEVLNYEYQASVDKDCQYTLEVKFQHQSSFPVGDANKCQPGVDAPEDNLPFLVGRWRWGRFPSYVREAFGLDHVSIDYNPCGHPGPGFLTPHYDLHFYRASPEYRVTEMVCALLPGTPACLTDGQDTHQGNAFFSVAKSSRTGDNINMPPNYTVHLPDAVINMGMHSWNNEQEPATPEEWINPIFIICSYDSQIVGVEPMIPFHYTTGDQDQFWEENIEYVEQTISSLPYYYSNEYDAATGTTTTILQGQSNICQAEFEELALLGDQQGGGNAASDAVSAGSVLAATIAVGVMLLTGM